MRPGGETEDWKVIPLASEAATVFESPEPGKAFIDASSLAVFPSGRIVVATDLSGPGVKKLRGTKGQLAGTKNWVQGQVVASTDKGETWTAPHEFPFCHPRLFRSGSDLYLLGHRRTLVLTRSRDGGATWSPPVDLTTTADPPVQSCGHPVHIDGRVYIAAMVQTDAKADGSACNGQAPMILRAHEGGNLLAAKSWTRSAPATPFRALVPFQRLDYWGVPVHDVPSAEHDHDVGNGRWAGRLGWRDPHLVHIADPDHYWHDGSGRSVHLLASAYTHRSNIAALAKVVSDDKGAMVVRLQSTPVRKKVAFVPLPGGHLPFEILHDEESKLYWLLSSQATDSMTRPNKIPRERRGLACEEGHRLQLHYSRNLVDWCFAAYVDAGSEPRDTRLAGGIAVRGNDLYLLSRIGGAECHHSLEATRIRLHVIEGFRELVY